MPKHDNKKKDVEKDLFESHNEAIKKITITLDEIWDRIGFNEQSKSERLKTFFEKAEEVCNQMLDSEEDLEEEIRIKIQEHRQDMRSLCFELGSKYDEKYANGYTMIDEEKLLRERVKQLQSEKTKRLDEYKQLSTKENDLCEKLKQKKSNIKSSVPTENEIESIKNHIKELEKIKIERVNQMGNLKEEIIKLFNDLDMSQSDSFSELIIYESIDDLPLSESDLERAKDLRDQLKIKDEKLIEQVKSLKFKIKQLWNKLSFNNANLIDIVENDDINKDIKTMNKAELIVMLNEEHERCLKIKMENLEKFIEQIRIEISVLYDKMYFSDTEIKLFDENFKSKDFTEDLLKIHEEKIEDLKFTYDEHTTLFEKTAKWLDMWQHFILFEEKTKDPNRFKVRGYNAVEEEKTRKQFQLQFPKLEEELRKYAEEYKNINGGEKTYTLYGYEWKTYLDMLRKDYEQHKQNEKNEKKQATNAAAAAANKKDNFSKHASKLITPSFQKSSIKRKNNECISTAIGQQTPSIIRNSKLQRTDACENTITSTMIAVNTPKNKFLNKNTKRKSRTPLKQRLRQSRGVVSTANSQHKQTSSILSTKSKKPSNSPKQTSKYKIPTKLTSKTNDSNDTTLTATSNGTVNSKASTTSVSNSNVSTYRNGGYPFRHINTNDINYHEFTRDLHKPFRFNGNGNSGFSSNNHVEHDIKTKLTSTLIKE